MTPSTECRKPRVKSLPIMVIVAGVGLVASPVAAQTPAPSCEVRGSHEWLSQRGSPFDSAVVQVGELTAKVCYSRPSARGRRVFGGLVQWGRAWRTGANEPTVLHLPFHAQVAGVSLAPGRYLLMTVPEETRWTIVFYTAEGTDPATMFQTMEQIGLGPVPVERTAEHVERFTIRGNAEGNTVEFVLEWERVRVRIPIVVVN